MVGDLPHGRQLVEKMLIDTLGFETHANPDFHEHSADNYTVDEARALKAAHYLKSVGERSVYIVSFNSITIEAQQALLKVCEDPVPHVHFFFITPSLEGIVSTLRSRFSIITVPRVLGASLKNSRAATFLASPPAERLKLIAALIEDKEKNAAIVFLNEIETAAAVLLRENRLAEAAALQDTIALRGFLHTRAPSIKMILEYLALTLPQIQV